MALFNFGKKKEEEKKTPACACSCGCAASEAESITNDCCPDLKKVRSRQKNVCGS